ncbi:MAG: flagellar hook-basal body complex protein FliE [Defluviitaleaceae bacterium]|nr:flagellar hook-basal body complex protein FliE [Defluviitaleaceae bacterium]MCL2261779.1 flagellar hook-basal body complex protein FliE [Defluviitaleaceae bacterium]
MSAITALVDTTPEMIALQPFSPNLQFIRMDEERSESPFSSFFNAALGTINDTNTMVANAEQMQLDFATGRIDDILSVQLAMDRASNAVTFTSQVTNRIIESYREIMRMQI